MAHLSVRCLQDTQQRTTSCAAFIKVIAGSALSLTLSLSNADEDDDDRVGPSGSLIIKVISPTRLVGERLASVIS